MIKKIILLTLKNVFILYSVYYFYMQGHKEGGTAGKIEGEKSS
jgi:Tfp pilus assembly protein PilZ